MEKVHKLCFWIHDAGLSLKQNTRYKIDRSSRYVYIHCVRHPMGANYKM